MTQSASVWAADRPPAMYRRATLAIVVSRISMNVGTTTTTATTQGLTAGRLTAAYVGHGAEVNRASFGMRSRR